MVIEVVLRTVPEVRRRGERGVTRTKYTGYCKQDEIRPRKLQLTRGGRAWKAALKA